MHGISTVEMAVKLQIEYSLSLRSRVYQHQPEPKSVITKMIGVPPKSAKKKRLVLHCEETQNTFISARSVVRICIITI
jgi:hypothetical protein